MTGRRWDGDFLTASALIKCGVLGRLVEFESHFDRYRPAFKMGWREDADLPGFSQAWSGRLLVPAQALLNGLGAGQPTGNDGTTHSRA